MKFQFKFLELFENIQEDGVSETIAILPGGFKPPTKGHFKAFEYLLQEANSGIVFIGKKERDGITSIQSKQIWDVYAKYLTKPIKVEIAEISPVRTVYEFADANLDKNLIVGAGSKDEDVKRFSYFEKNINTYPLVRVVKIPIQEGGISGSLTRSKILNKDDDAVDYFTPDVLSSKDKSLITQILNI